MGKPPATEPKPKKDGFFTNKRNLRNNRPFRESISKSGKVEPSSSAGAGSFFVTPTEKQDLLLEREAKKINTNQKFERKSNTEEKSKKTFDKKKWRLQKYSKKYKLQQWEEKRKKSVLHQYYKQIDEDEPKFDVQKIYEQYKDDDDDNDGENNKDEFDNKPKEEEIDNENNLNKNLIEEKIEIDELGEPSQANTSSQSRKKKAFKKAHIEYQRIQDEKRQRKEDIEKKKVENVEAMKEYKQKKLEKYKKLNKKTKKGQPIMKYRMEMLLEQIQKSVQ